MHVTNSTDSFVIELKSFIGVCVLVDMYVRVGAGLIQAKMYHYETE